MTDPKRFSEMSFGERVARGEQGAADLLAEHFRTTFTDTSSFPEEALRFEALATDDTSPAMDRPFEVGELCSGHR